MSITHIYYWKYVNQLNPQNKTAMPTTETMFNYSQ